MTREMVNGFDAAIAAQGGDLLGRWPLALEIAHLATTAPKEWSVRIGVFGEWGSGKTSVMNFVREAVEAGGHIPVDFNVWGHQDADEMWRAFVEATLVALERANVRGTKPLRKRHRAAEALRMGRKLAGFHKASKDVADTVASLFGDVLGVNPGEVRALADALGNRRVVVFVDDIDRASPEVVPPLLFAVRELLDVGGISFVLALDPDVVSAALARHHDGWDKGRKFLDKIVEFQRWIPRPSREALTSLVVRDLNNDCTFVDRSQLADLYDLLPRNARAARSIVRSMWGLGRQAERARPGEINWQVVLCAELLKHSHRELPRAVLESSRVLRCRAENPWWGREPNEQEQRESEQRWQAILKEFELQDDAEERLRRTAEALLRTAAWMPSGEALRLAYLAEEPPVVAGQEFDAFFETATDFASVRDWVLRHSAEVRVDAKVVVDELVQAVSSAYETGHSEAADAPTEAESRQAVERVSLLVDMLDRLLSRQGAEFGGGVTPGRFRATFGRFVHWAHFTNTPYYVALRAKERDLLLSLAQVDDLLALEIFREVQPWSGEFAFSERRKLLVDQVLGALRGRAGASVVDQAFRVANRTSQLFHSAELAADRDLLLDLENPAWSKEEGSMVNGFVDDAARDAIVHANFLDFASGVASSGHLSERGKAFCDDTWIRAKLWQGASAQASNVRRFRSLAGLRRSLHQPEAAPLDVPSWWGRVWEQAMPAETKEVAVGAPIEEVWEVVEQFLRERPWDDASLSSLDDPATAAKLELISDDGRSRIYSVPLAGCQECRATLSTGSESAQGRTPLEIRLQYELTELESESVSQRLLRQVTEIVDGLTERLAYRPKRDD